MSGFFYVTAIALVIIYFIFNATSGSLGPETREEKFVKCVERGIIFYKEHDAYPIITIGADKGKKAIEVTRKRCDINVNEFKDVVK